MTGTAAVWASLPVPAVLIDAEGRTAEVNAAAELFLNLSARSLTGQGFFDRVAIDAPLEEAFARIRASRSPVFINDVAVGTGDRAPVLCNLQAAPLTDDPDTILLLIAPREFAERLGRGGQVKSAAKSAIGMAEMLAHEIKNPLAGITGAAQLLSMSLSPEDQELTDLIVAESRRIVKLLEQVEQFGNLRPPEKRPVNIHDVLDRARRSALLGFAAHMTIVEDYDPSLPPTAGDADQLVQVFLNLIRNAAEAAPQGGTIRIHSFYDLSLRLRRPDGSGAAVPLQVEIIDDGPGIREDLAADIFDPFVSGRENGTGLGLALVSKILADHGGWISVDSVPGRTVFRVSLPVAPKTPPERTA
ncbi:two-component system sensor histidine kinase NtrB [Albidovulum sp.]|uniref:two-component system sensor histidine kinase NtrB n=1 Tax=Albidovulum sp. TaxID=1872424 RepID=UPI001E0EC645|nr:PAS domain-containing protein [Paracoccaceae bacterium]HPE24553.1 ATP-binding protein [Albidovulum sp.]MCP5323944.1 PAS domain-containing protein [Paracoccaceae bacterium]MCP5356481.1 PAS domain-containing protein [Paracoccaceae bacterium]MCP5376909.1 PAS domain-containing protein [Paracoccaceae bacterium]